MSRLSFSRAVVPALAALLGLLPAAARAEVPSRVPIQGTLRDVAGAPIDGTLPCTFSLYAQRAGGVALWTETEDVPFDAGFFSLYLGARSPLRVSFFRDNQLLYLGIAVDGDPEMARIELATAPFAAFAQYAGDALTVGGLHASDFAPVDHRTDWTTLDNIPADLADGDANTTYDTTAGGGLTLSGTSFGLDTTCTPGQLLKRDAAGWSCADDAQGADNPTDELLQTVTYDPATHVLSLTDAGQTFNLDLTTLAAPDADADPTNELTVSATLDGTTLHLTDAGGTLDVDLSSLVVDLSTVDQSDQNELNTALVLNGTELVLTDAGGDLTVDLAALQDGNTTYTAGNGLTLTDTEFAVDTTVVQSRVSGACAVGSSIQTIGEDGSVTCEVDADTLYAAGSGLALAGTVFSVDPAAVQSRVSGVCAPGSSVQTIAPDGTVTCEIDDNTTYTAGGGLALAGTIFSVDPATVQSRVAGTCPAGSSIRTVAQDGTVACETDDNTTYTAGSGLGLVGTVFSVNPLTIQSRVTGTCPAGSSIQTIAQDGTVTCEPDDNTTYTAGTGLTLVGTTFAAKTTGQQGSYDLPQPNGLAADAQTTNWLGLRFRIAGGGVSGRVEFTRDGATWGTVCADGFDTNANAARVVCRSMGYSDGAVLNAANTADGAAGQPILIDDMQCPADARNFLDCRVSAIGTSNCVHAQDVGVVCTP